MVGVRASGSGTVIANGLERVTISARTGTSKMILAGGEAEAGLLLALGLLT